MLGFGGSNSANKPEASGTTRGETREKTRVTKVHVRGSRASRRDLLNDVAHGRYRSAANNGGSDD